MLLERKIIAVIMMHAKRVSERYERATWKPAEAQKRKLLSIAGKNKHTEYGKRYDFSSIKSVSDFQRQVPVITYEDIRDDIKRVAAGEKNILTAEAPIMFARTSGTMGQPKYIIVTQTCQNREHSAIASTWGYHLLTSHPEIHKGVSVMLVSTAIEGYTSGGIPYGSTSGSIYKNMPAIFRKKYAIPYDVFEISDYQAKYYAIMRLAMEQDASVVSTANPSSILIMCEKGNEFGEEIIKDIHNGTLSNNYKIEPKIRKFIEKRLKPNPKRSAFLEEARSKRNGILLPADYWPNLKLITCWKGGTVGHYIEKFPQWFNPDGDRNIPIRDWGYLSSEARCSIPITDEGSAGILAITTNFYEFVTVEDQTANPDDPSIWEFLTVDKLEDGREYYIFITTMGGLYRYDINDIIRVEGYHNNTPKIVFVRKGRDMTNMTGEKLSADQVIQATQRASRQTGVNPCHFKVEADLQMSRYILRIELYDHISHVMARDFLRSFDENLKDINIEYKAKRDSMRIADPVMHIMRKGWFDNGQRLLAENGNRVFQTKAQVLSQEKSDTQEIMSQVEEVIGECIVR